MAARMASAQAKDQVSEMADQAREVAGQAQDRAQEAAERWSDRAREQVDLRSTEAGERVETAAQDARSVADVLREQDKESAARLADQVADRAEWLADYLVQATPDDMLADIEDLGRRQPWTVAFGGLALGFAGARFLGSSSQQRSASAIPRPQRVGRPRDRVRAGRG